MKRSFSLLSSLFVVLLAGLPVSQAVASITLAQEPLFLTNRIKPNFIMAVDDSGSMDFEVSFPGNDGSAWWNYTRRSFVGLDNNDSPVNGVETLNFNRDGVSTNTVWKKYSYLFPFGTGTDGRVLSDSTNDHFAIPPTADFAWARSPDYNRSYFNPLATYEPWQSFDGSEFPNANPTAARSDPMRGTRLLNLTQPFVFIGANSEFMFHRDMRLPVGTYYRVGTCSSGGVSPNNTSDPLQTGTYTNFRRAIAVRTVGGTEGRSRCSIAIGYFPATFYIRDVGGRADTIAASIGYRTTAIDRSALSPGDASGNNRVTMARFEIQPANFTSTAAYNTTIQNFANWFTYYRKRQHATRGGMSRAFSGFDFINAGYFTINNRVNVTMRDMAIPADRQALYNQFLNLSPGGGTPNRDAVNHLGNQFRRNGTGAPITLACQRNFGMLFTDGFSNPTSGATYGNVDGTLGVPFADSAANTLADIATRHYLDNLRPDLQPGRVPVANQCSGSSPDPRLNCRRDPHMTFYGVTLGARGQTYDPDANPAQDPFANPVTWPTTFAARAPSAVDDIWHATINTRGEFLNARTPREITDAIRSILISVQDSAVPAGRDATSGARVSANTFFVIPSFRTRNNGTDWAGSLVAYRLNPDASLGPLVWSTGSGDPGDAASKIPSATSRNLFFNLSPGNRTGRQPRNFSAANLGTTEDARFTALGVTAADRTIYNPLTAQQAVDYLRGDRSLEQARDSSGVLTGGRLRARSSLLGDIVNSTPVIFTRQENFGYTRLPGTAGTSYRTFIETRAASTTPSMVYVGANDGYLHAFNGDTGIEQFGFIPNGVLNQTGRLLNPQYQHRYFVDGLTTVADAQIDGNWGSALVGGTGAGSRTLYALNVSSPTTVGPNQVLWELSGNTLPELGHVFGRPLILPVRGASGPRWVAIVGNGYNSTYAKPALLVVDLNTGDVIANIKPSTTSTTANGLGNLVALADSDGYVNTVYGGDLAGHVWKFDLSGSNPSSWSVALGGLPLFQARDAANNPQPITGGLDVARGPNGNILVYFGTGRYIAQGDNQIDASTQTQTLYGVLDRNAPISAGRASLASRSITTQTSGSTSTRQIQSGVVNYLTQNGWFVDLRLATAPFRGERFVGFPRVEGGQVYFSTFEPQGDACTPGGINWLYGLDTITGSPALNNLRLPGVDADGDGQPDTLCTTNCGAVETGSGAPVPETVILVPRPNCVPGTAGCPIPVTCEADPTNAACVPEDELNQDALYEGCVKIISVGGRQIIQPRPCGRQSWRQIR